jgi:L-ascorbate metabolism protein UlaG (beta-lactamase superfamily)
MGDVGNPLSDAQMQFFEGLDVLLALTGGHPTIELDDLMAVIERVQPRVVVPMHFRTLSYKPRGIYWIEAFLKYFDESADVDFALGYETTLTRARVDALPSRPRVLVLDYVK